MSREAMLHSNVAPAQLHCAMPTHACSEDTRARLPLLPKIPLSAVPKLPSRSSSLTSAGLSLSKSHPCEHRLQDPSAPNET